MRTTRWLLLLLLILLLVLLLRPLIRLLPPQSESADGRIHGRRRNTTDRREKVHVHRPRSSENEEEAAGPRGKGVGRGRSDPRMDRALRLKLADPGLSLLDALKGGGFVFNTIVL